LALLYFPSKGLFFIPGLPSQRRQIERDGLRGTWVRPVLGQIQLLFKSGTSCRFLMLLFVGIDAHSIFVMSYLMWCFFICDVISRCWFNVNSTFSPCSQGCVLSFGSFEYSVRGLNCRHVCLFLPSFSIPVIIVSHKYATFSAEHFVHCCLMSTFPFEHTRSQDILICKCVVCGFCNWFHFHVYTSNISYICEFSWSFGYFMSFAIGVCQLSDVLGRPRLLSNFGVRRGFSV